MTMKDTLQSRLRQEQAAIARKVLAEGLRGGIPGSRTMGELVAELQDEELLWETFQGLTPDEFRGLLSASRAETSSPPGPSRKRGATSKNIVKFLRQNPGAKRKEIATALGLQGGTLSSQLRALRQAGKLKVEGKERKFGYFVA